METKIIRISFDLERAKRIQSGKEDGRIVLRNAEFQSVEILRFDLRSSQPIVAVTHCIDCDKAFVCSENGRLSDYHGNPDDLMLEIPTLIQCNDGDILTQSDCDCPFIFKKLDDNEYMFYAGIDIEGELIITEEDETWCIITDGVRHATKEEEQKLIDALKESDEPLAKEYLKRFFNIEVEPKYEFQPFQQVLVRNEYKWECDIFNRFVKGAPTPYCCLSGSWKHCIPYNDETKHLIGTTDNYNNNN